MPFLLSDLSLHVVVALLVLFLAWGAIYRIYLSPLAKFPGPKLAALTLWYEFYYDVIKRGKFTWEIQRMHQKYGKSALYLSFAYLLSDNLKALLCALIHMSSMSPIRISMMNCTLDRANRATSMSGRPGCLATL